VTQAGGSYGNIFSIGTDGTNFRSLFSFNGNNGSSPQGSLILSGSTLYGMAEQGGNYGDGVIFSIGTDGTNFRSLFSFNGTNGSSPQGSLILSGSTLYGMAEQGGNDGDGAIFSIGTDGTGFQDLLSFSGSNGANPYYGELTLSGNTLYGMTSGGGAHSDGTVFELTLNPTPEPSTFALLGAGVAALLVYELRRRLKKRVAPSSTKVTAAEESPAILSFRSGPIEAQRRAA
jgi:uncharacterized repeat protein (TIGR03803 family)